MSSHPLEPQTPSIVRKRFLGQLKYGQLRQQELVVGKSIAAENAWQTSCLMYSGARVPTISDGFDKQHAEVGLSPFELRSKEFEGIINYILVTV